MRKTMPEVFLRKTMPEEKNYARGMPEKNYARGEKLCPSPKGVGRFQDRGQSFSHPDRRFR